MSLSRVSALALLMVSLGSAVALADTNPQFSQQVAQKPEGNGRQNRAGLMQQLNLTPQQQQQLDAIRKNSQQQMSQRKQALRQAMQELGNLMAGTADENTIRTKHSQVQQLQQEMANLRFESMLKTRAILTPAQRQQFAQLMQQRRENFRNRPGNRTGQPQ